jgi:hypothetical protein
MDTISPNDSIAASLPEESSFNYQIMNPLVVGTGDAR